MPTTFYTITAGSKSPLRRIRAYFFETRQQKGWRNTIETASILATILPDVLDLAFWNPGPNQVSLRNGDMQKEIDKLPFSMELQGDAGEIRLSKKDKAPLFISISQSQWLADPAPVDSLFAIQTELVQNGQPNRYLKTGQAAELCVKLKVKKAASYFALEVPIPAGCSYGAKAKSSYPEVHREHRKEKVNMYFRDLPPGDYAFSIQLEVRYAGCYTLNPAKAELMYEPMFYGRNGMKSVEIQD